MSHPDHQRDYNAEILNNIPDHAPAPAPIDADDISGHIEARSSNGLVEVSIERKSQQVANILIGSLTDVEAVEASIVEAVNKGLEQAQSGDGLGFEEAVDERMAEFDKAMEALNTRMDDLNAQLSAAFDKLNP